MYNKGNIRDKELNEVWTNKKFLLVHSDFYLLMQSINKEGNYRRFFIMNKMINYCNEKINFNGCPACAYANHEFDLPCGMAYENG